MLLKEDTQEQTEKNPQFVYPKKQKTGERDRQLRKSLQIKKIGGLGTD